MRERIDLSTAPSAMEALAASWAKPAPRPPAPPRPTRCRICFGELSDRNRTGYCVRHVAIGNQRNPEWREKQRAGVQRKLKSDPDYVEKLRASARRAAAVRDPGAMRERWLRDRVWEKSNAAHPPGSPSRLKAAQAISNRRLAHIPPELRDEYRQLQRSTRMRAHEALARLESDHPKAMQRWRAEAAARG